MKESLVAPNIEESCLGAILVKPTHLKSIIEETRLKPEHFHSVHNQITYSMILKLYEQGDTPDAQLVTSHLNGEVPKDYAIMLSTQVESPGAVVSYAKRVVELYQWRERRQASLDQLNAVDSQDLEAYSRAKTRLESDVIHQSSHFTPADLTKTFTDFLDDDSPASFKLPFTKLNWLLGGGFRKGNMVVIGGWTSHGKSIITDQMLESFSEQGYSCHLYMNEMALEERVARIISGRVEISVQEVLDHRRLDKEKKIEVYNAAKDLPFGITPCAGWSVHELAYDIRCRDDDVVAVDILHQFDYESEIELARISRFLNRLAKQTGKLVIATVHLNEFRAKDAVKPRPVTRDIRGSGMIKNDADIVMFVYREQDPYSGDPLAPSNAYLSKVRNGSLGGQNLMMDSTRLKFNPLPDEPF